MDAMQATEQQLPKTIRGRMPRFQVKPEVVATGRDGKGDAETVQALSNLIRNNYPVLQGAKAAVRTARQQLKDELLTRPDYAKADEAAKKAREDLKTAKAKAMQDPRIYKMSELVKDKAHEAKELQLSFSDWLVEYGDQTGAKTFDLGFGKPLKIKKTATL